MSAPAARRIVVGVDFSAESAAALRWACREASLRGAEVHAVHAREAQFHSTASYAVPAQDRPAQDRGDNAEDASMWRSVMPDAALDVEVRTEIVEGLAARVLLGRCDGADMLVLGAASDASDAMRSAGPVIRACLRRALCPVVVISVAQEPLPREEALAPDTDVQLPVMVPVSDGLRVPEPSGVGLEGGPGGPGAPGRGMPVPAGA